jgi:predicted acetyltransferase
VGYAALMSAPPRIQLVPPTEILRVSFLSALREFQQEGLPWWRGGDLALAEQDFAAFVSRKLDPSLAATHRWAVSGDLFVGRLSIRHELNDALRIEGGHIGYDTVPSFRGRGIATEMLRQALPVARTLGLQAVLITCDDTNAASIRVIERNGGVLEKTRVLAPDRPPKRYYWITLTQR